MYSEWRKASIDRIVFILRKHILGSLSSSMDVTNEAMVSTLIIGFSVYRLVPILGKMLCCRKRWIYKLQMNSHFCLCRDDWFKNFTHSSIVCLQVLYGVEG